MGLPLPGLRVCTATPIYWRIKCVKFLSQNSIGVSIKSTHFLKIELAHEKSQLTSPKLGWRVKFYIRIIRYVFKVTLASRHDRGMPASADQLKSAKQCTQCDTQTDWPTNYSLDFVAWGEGVWFLSPVFKNIVWWVTWVKKFAVCKI